MTEQLLGVRRRDAGMDYVRCPLWAVCGWQTADRSHLDRVVVIDTEATRAARAGDDPGALVTRHVNAVEYLNTELREHLAAHTDQLQDLLAAASGGRGEQQLVQVTMQLDVRTVRHAPDGVATDHAVRYLRTHLAAELIRQRMRPLDPWPAVTVRRLVFSGYPDGNHVEDLPRGTRELHPDDPRQPDLFQLELRTLAQSDLRAVVL